MRAESAKAYGKRSLAAILILVLLMSLAGCAFVDKIQNRIDPNASKISAPELVRLLVVAINDQNMIGSSYEAIPEVQREGISFSYFSQYVSILKSLGGNAKIDRFTFLDEEENSDRLDKIYKRMCQQMPAGDFKSTFEPYGSVKTVELQYSKKNVSNSRMYISFDSEGTAYLSYDWIMDLIDTYNYMNHYFNMLEKNNSDGIAVLIKSKSGFSTIYSEDVIDSKAQYTVDFYRMKVKNSFDQFVLKEINAFYVDYEIPEVLSADGQSLYSRNLYAFRGNNGDIDIIDDIPQEVDNNVITVPLSQNQMIRCGLEYDSSVLQRMMGKPVKVIVQDENIYDTDDPEKVRSRVCFMYKGIHLVFDASYTDENDWMGELVSITLVTNSQVSYSVCDLKLGDSEESILKRFPMIKYGDYTLNYSVNASSFDLVYEVTDGVITGITITEEGY